MALTYKEGTSLGEQYRKLTEAKVKKILPLLNGLSYNQVQDILVEISESIKRLPITKASPH